MINHHILLTAISKQTVLRTRITDCKWKFSLNPGCRKNGGSYALSSLKSMGNHKSTQQSKRSIWKKIILWGRGRKGKKNTLKSFIKYYIRRQAKSWTPERRLCPWQSPEQDRGHHTEDEESESEALPGW